MHRGPAGAGAPPPGHAQGYPNSPPPAQAAPQSWGAPMPVLSANLPTEQEWLKMMLPSTEVHKSVKSWVTPQMLCVRFVTKHGHRGQRETRVLCLTPTIIFLCHPVGEVRRFVKLAQVESCIASEVMAGGQVLPHLLIKCSYPEHDMLLTFVNDSRNVDTREGPHTVLQRLEQIKRLRGEYFPVKRISGGPLFDMANLRKCSDYIAPKRRLDWSRFESTEDQDVENSDIQGPDPVDRLGGDAGIMGIEQPIPVPSGLGRPASPCVTMVKPGFDGSPTRRLHFADPGSPQRRFQGDANVTTEFVGRATPGMGSGVGSPVGGGPGIGSPVGAAPTFRITSVVRSKEEAQSLVTQLHRDRLQRQSDDVRRWDVRGIVANRVGSPRPEDLGFIAADRSQRPRAADFQNHDYGYGPDDVARHPDYHPDAASPMNAASPMPIASPMASERPPPPLGYPA
eukprot:Hpha_TRINITY_DN6196_c0_g1::TRINITY_DN6196_c0_g1_i1::g.165043::m.165043